MTREELIKNCKVYKGEDEFPRERLKEKYDLLFWLAEEKYVWLLSDNGENYKEAQQHYIDKYLEWLESSEIEFEGIPRLLQGIMLPFADKGEYYDISNSEKKKKLVEKIFPNYLAR